MHTELKNSKRLKDLYHRALTIKSAIPHPRILGVIRECGGKMHMHERSWSEAATDFFEARFASCVSSWLYLFKDFLRIHLCLKVETSKIKNQMGFLTFLATRMGCLSADCPSSLLCLPSVNGWRLRAGGYSC